VLATLTGNGLGGRHSAAFDGERILVANNQGNRVSIWKAGDLTRRKGFAFTWPLESMRSAPLNQGRLGLTLSVPSGASLDPKYQAARIKLFQLRPGPSRGDELLLQRFHNSSEFFTAHFGTFHQENTDDVTSR
jgi:hypothetical protein